MTALIGIGPERKQQLDDLSEIRSAGRSWLRPAARKRRDQRRKADVVRPVGVGADLEQSLQALVRRGRSG